jgi:hypothetical protein
MYFPYFFYRSTQLIDSNVTITIRKKRCLAPMKENYFFEVLSWTQHCFLLHVKTSSSGLVSRWCEFKSAASQWTIRGMMTEWLQWTRTGVPKSVWGQACVMDDYWFRSVENLVQYREFWKAGNNLYQTSISKLQFQNIRVRVNYPVILFFVFYACNLRNYFWYYSA